MICNTSKPKLAPDTFYLKIVYKFYEILSKFTV